MRVYCRTSVAVSHIKKKNISEAAAIVSQESKTQIDAFCDF